MTSDRRTDLGGVDGRMTVFKERSVQDGDDVQRGVDQVPLRSKAMTGRGMPISVDRGQVGPAGSPDRWHARGRFFSYSVPRGTFVKCSSPAFEQSPLDITIGRARFCWGTDSFRTTSKESLRSLSPLAVATLDSCLELFDFLRQRGLHLPCIRCVHRFDVSFVVRLAIWTARGNQLRAAIRELAYGGVNHH